jgi:hypothetical protein
MCGTYNLLNITKEERKGGKKLSKQAPKKLLCQCTHGKKSSVSVFE